MGCAAEGICGALAVILEQHSTASLTEAPPYTFAEVAGDGFNFKTFVRNLNKHSRAEAKSSREAVRCAVGLMLKMANPECHRRLKERAERGWSLPGSWDCYCMIRAGKDYSPGG